MTARHKRIVMGIALFALGAATGDFIDGSRDAVTQDGLARDGVRGRSSVVPARKCTRRPLGEGRHTLRLHL